ncbi:FmdB family zinc ribbon protein [Tahibacter amnicola]|uniref:Zinc ribbon domain-containing protein n=1 Tax=Tahibacter amnicola TaxID=2976241 RepID=A0ABY6BDL5_9GAMM|nr:zinc ribbon domain-containing protein [Tahibacter amnicola]UXI67681.1 zinc ribbon domain-containing protein [Tahibacter amnicola]
MPIYEFECADCGNRFDRLQKLSDPDPTDCPSCTRPSVQRRVTAPAFRLAGGGWYETDFKKDGDKKRNLASNDGGSPASTGDSGGVLARPPGATNPPARARTDSGGARCDARHPPIGHGVVFR